MDSGRSAASGRPAERQRPAAEEQPLLFLWREGPGQGLAGSGLTHRGGRAGEEGEEGAGADSLAALEAII